MTPDWLNDICFDEQGLIPAIAQDANTGRILMFAWMNHDAIIQTIELGQAVYWSRSRGTLWHKGEISGHIQQLKDIRLDCDGDAILLQVEQIGGIACHTGRESCFYRQFNQTHWRIVDPVLKSPDAIYGTAAQKDNADQTIPLNSVSSHNVTEAEFDHMVNDTTLLALSRTIEQRKLQSPETSYVSSLYHKGLNKILEKVGEEAIETILAAKEIDTQSPSAKQLGDLVYETADLWFHSLVALSAFNLDASAVIHELQRRFGLSGLEEKASRHSK